MKPPRTRTVLANHFQLALACPGAQGLDRKAELAEPADVFRKLLHVLLVAALLATVGGHWVVLQSVAWVGMIASYSQDSTLSEALTKTFDGDHPCCLCKQIAKGKECEKKSDVQIAGQKLEFVEAHTLFVFSAPGQFRLLSLLQVSLAPLTQAPPVPPPRSFFA